jgi:NDP-sugar pyrophosphorylase family protein
LILVKGKPILEYNIELCKTHGVTALFINTHHHAKQIRNVIGDGSRFGLAISYSYEPELLGTAGALRNFKEGIGSDPFYVVYGDNLSDFDLLSLRNKTEAVKALGTIGFHRREDVSSSGVAEFDKDGRVLRFIEKPTAGESPSHWVNAGVYHFANEILSLIPEGSSDFAKDIFPNLIRQGLPIYGICSDANVSAFDTPEMYYSSFRKLK